MGTFFGLAVAIFVIVAIIGKYTKKENNSRNKNTNQQYQARTSAPQKSGSLDLANEIKSKHGNSTINTNNSNNNSTNTNNRTAFQKEIDQIEKKKQQLDKQNNHNHPSAKGNIRVEKAFIEDSMGDNQTEGCEEHYYLRYVGLNKETQENKLNEELARMMVMGEVLNNPGYKKHRRH